MSEDLRGGLDRRTFFALCTASGLGGTVMPGLLWTRLEAQAAAPRTPQGPPQAPQKITREMITGAEQVAGLTFTDAERDMMIQNLNNALQSFEQVRAVPLPNPVLPALVFHPLLPGRQPGIAEGQPAGPTARQVRRPAAEEDLAFRGVAGLAELVRTRQVTATELTRLAIRRLKQYGPGLECLVNLTEERALRQAEQADREIASGRYRGPLHGIPWGAKDLLAVPGYPTTWGSPIYRDQVLEQTATVVERLDAAGAILVAKLSLGEFAQGDVWYGGTTKNPWNTSQGSSGSSAGPAAAVSAGLVPFAIGSETMGSIVSPSTRCGVTGLRPTFGRVSRAGAMALSWTMDKLGPMARSVEDCALVFAAIHGPDGKDPTVHAVPFPWNPAAPLSSVRIGYLKSAFEASRPGKALDDAALEAMRGLGAPLVEVEVPRDLPVGALRMILSAEAAAAFDQVTRSNQDDLMVRQVSSAWPNSFRSARFIPAVEYINANRVRTLLMEKMEEVFAAVDVFVTPSFGGNVLQITNYTAHPAVVLPSGFTAEGSPVSLSFIGRPFGEAAACLVAHRWQEATGWHLKRPSGYA
jgi:Asp-tRNA(Asn)/Glu-tRNA(Gln) amidotransferase A subunit family amidase